MRILLEELLHLCFGISLKEVSPSFGYYLHFGGVFESIDKAFMTLGIGGRAFGTTYFGYIAFAFENAYCIKPCFFAYLVIIGSHIGSITFGSDFPIYQNHRNSLLVSLFNNWGTGFRLVRRNDEHIYLLLYEPLYIGDLLGSIVFHTANEHLSISLIEGYFTFEFLVHRLSPKVFTTLRHPYYITGVSLPLASEASKESEV